MEAVIAEKPHHRGIYELVVIGALVVMTVDVLGLFVAGAFHWALMLKAALSIFVYIQMAMTAASILSIPGTLIVRAGSGMGRKRSTKTH